MNAKDIGIHMLRLQTSQGAAHKASYDIIEHLLSKLDMSDLEDVKADMDPKLTEQQKRDYIEGVGSECPFCADSGLIGGTIEIDSSIAWQPVECQGCKSTWNDEYTLTGISEEKQNGR